MIMDNNFSDPLNNAFLPLSHDQFPLLTQEQKNQRLVLAVIMGPTKIEDVAALIKAGADLEPKEDNDNSVLIWAARGGKTEVVTLLIQSGANVEAKERHHTGTGNTALTCAADQGHTEIVRLLLQVKANIEATEYWGNTPLMLAASNGHTATVALLIQKKANLGAINKKRITALGLASYHSKSETAYTLLSAMTPEQVTEEIDSCPVLQIKEKLQYMVTQYYQALKNQQDKLFSIFGPLLLQENQASYHQSHYAMLPSEILATSLAFQFPSWYAPYLTADINFTFDMIQKITNKRREEAKKHEQEMLLSPTAVLIFTDEKSNKRKADTELTQQKDTKKPKLTKADNASNDGDNTHSYYTSSCTLF